MRMRLPSGRRIRGRKPMWQVDGVADGKVETSPEPILIRRSGDRRSPCARARAQPMSTECHPLHVEGARGVVRLIGSNRLCEPAMVAAALTPGTRPRGVQRCLCVRSSYAPGARSGALARLGTSRPSTRPSLLLRDGRHHAAGRVLRGRVHHDRVHGERRKARPAQQPHARAATRCADRPGSATVP